MTLMHHFWRVSPAVGGSQHAIKAELGLNRRQTSKMMTWPLGFSILCFPLHYQTVHCSSDYNSDDMISDIPLASLYNLSLNLEQTQEKSRSKSWFTLIVQLAYCSFFTDPLDLARRFAYLKLHCSRYILLQLSMKCPLVFDICPFWHWIFKSYKADM